MNISNTLRRRLARPEFPRASSYDPDWVFETMMGPNALWLAEWASHEERPGLAGAKPEDHGAKSERHAALAWRDPVGLRDECVEGADDGGD